MSESIPIRAPSGRIAFATIESLTLGASADPLAALKNALRPGTRVERHNRTWRMGKWQEEGASIVGRIGFQSSALAELWDDEIEDFKEMARPLGFTSPFAIVPSEMRIAFQLRGKEIRPKSFTGALQALMNEASPDDRWRVHRDLQKVPLDEWVGSVDRVLDVRLSLQRPNPHYGRCGRIEELVEGTNSGSMEVAAHADSDDPQGLDLTDPLFKEGIEHAQKNYGHASIIGETDGQKSQWSSDDDSVAEIRTALTDPDTQEVSPRALRIELGDETAVAEETREAREDVEAFKADIEDERGDEPDMRDHDDGQR